MGADSRDREPILPHSGLLMLPISLPHQLHPTVEIFKNMRNKWDLGGISQ